MSDEAAGAFKFGLPSGSDVESNAVSAMLTAATIVLCWYDHSLTLSREVKGFWKQRLSISSWLYFVNRYVTMICGLLLTVRLVTWAPQPPRMANQICNIASMLTGVCKITIHLVFALFASIRTYAIWGKNTKILVCVLLLGLVYPIGYAYYTVCTTSSAAPPPLLGCLEYTNTPIKPIYFLGIGSTALFEGIAIALTWAKTVPDIYRARRNNHSSIFPMTHAIFYDGTLLFIVIIISNCAGLFAMAWPSLTVLFTFSDILGSLMTSRFLLDLREDYISKLPDGHWEDSSFHISDMSTIQFNFTLDPYDSDESFVLSNIGPARI